MMRREGTLPLTAPLRYAGSPLFDQKIKFDPEELRAEQYKAVDHLARRVLWRNPRAEVEPLIIAGRWAIEAHEKAEKKTRRSGEPYINHPSRVTNRVIAAAPDVLTACVAFLHDTKEDVFRGNFTRFTELCYRYLSQHPGFAEELDRVVDGVTKLIREREKTLAHWNEQCSGDNRIAVVKLGDRVDNQLDWFWQKPETRQDKSRETRQVFAPAAWRLGLWEWRSILLDTSMRDLEPEIYWPLLKERGDKLNEHEEDIEQARGAISDILRKAGFNVKIFNRPRCLWDIWNKHRGDDIFRVHPIDLLSFAVRVDSSQRDAEALAFWCLSKALRHVTGTYRDGLNHEEKAPFYQALGGHFIFGKYAIRLKFFDRAGYLRATNGVAAGAAFYPLWHRVAVGYFRNVADFAAQEGLSSAQIGQASERLIGEVTVLDPHGNVHNVPRGKNGEAPTVLDAAACFHTSLPARIEAGKRGNALAYMGGQRVGLNFPLRSGEVLSFTLAEEPIYDARRFWACHNQLTVRSLRASYRHLDTVENRSILVEGGRQVLNSSLAPLLLGDKDLEGSRFFRHFMAHFWQHNLDGSVRSKALERQFSSEEIGTIFSTEQAKAEWSQSLLKDELEDGARVLSLEDFYYLMGFGFLNPQDFVEAFKAFRVRNEGKIPEKPGYKRTMVLELIVKKEAGTLSRTSARLEKLGLTIGPRDNIEPADLGDDKEKIVFLFLNCSKIDEIQIRRVTEEFKALPFVLDAKNRFEEIRQREKGILAGLIGRIRGR
ncbi:hypothetical protein A2462_04340 [candidate division WOR-1 bacterium RIFOXYC2_FULL_41_25]|uniref:HD/PDEase domain-containing protein n=1 Tax=candidate division WOR-1 bacterium RIFOXYC2_FULL_41_25 TaxID=1802586 RepID=A0A1F4TPD9_UNCSA|nr:MAG: hypothetical protein A2462_04340 [candidate division WOR-1 bacterium RIFOXYC2_FULL_41_25]